MKRILAILVFFFLLSCDNNSTNRNPYLQEVGFRFDLNLNLPLYSALTNTGSAVYVGNAAVGTRGAFVINTGFNSFMAWEASCPNHAPNNCSTMSLKGQLVTCSCEGYEYNLFTGQLMNRPEDGKTYHDLLFYRATQSGNTVIISN
jgi:nitrite reductase/ring-hydroxylating ferredoxin subunit